MSDRKAEMAQARTELKIALASNDKDMIEYWQDEIESIRVEIRWDKKLRIYEQKRQYIAPR